MRILILISLLVVAGCTPAPATLHDYKPLIAVAEGQALSQTPAPAKSSDGDCCSPVSVSELSPEYVSVVAVPSESTPPPAVEPPTVDAATIPVVFNSPPPAKPAFRYYAPRGHWEQRGLLGRRSVWVAD